MVTMGSKVERTLSDTEDFWEEGYLAAESANRLRVFYLFEDNLSFTDIFRYTIKIINEADFAWKDYIEVLDNFPKLDDDDMWNDPMRKMAASLVTIHRSRLDISCDEDDLLATIELLRVYCVNFLHRLYPMTDFSEEELRKWTRDRHKWVSLEISEWDRLKEQVRIANTHTREAAV